MSRPVQWLRLVNLNTSENLNLNAMKINDDHKHHTYRCNLKIIAKERSQAPLARTAAQCGN